jgi:hypothetical protein
MAKAETEVLAMRPARASVNFILLKRYVGVFGIRVGVGRVERMFG